MKRNSSPWSLGITIVELLVVMAIAAVLATAAGLAYVRAGRMERNLRREAFVRTALALQLERIERGLSLSNGILSTNADGRLDVSVSYPLETGGVAFETNRIMRVRSANLALQSRDARLSVTNRSESLELQGVSRRLSASPLLEPNRLGDARMDGLEIRSVGTGLVSIRLMALVPFETTGGTNVWRTVSADRMVRLWNE